MKFSLNKIIYVKFYVNYPSQYNLDRICEVSVFGINSCGKINDSFMVFYILNDIINLKHIYMYMNTQGFKTCFIPSDSIVNIAYIIFFSNVKKVLSLYDV